VSDWNSLFLGAIALATLVMAASQVAANVAAARLAKRLERMADDVNREVRPLIARAVDIADEARRTAALASQQIERVDRMMAELTLRVSETAETLQRTVLAPVRQGSALVAGLRAGFEALRSLRQPSQRPVRVEDEDALFIG
jgi:hypothetical protein